MQLETHSAQETENLGESFAKHLRPGDIVALYGGLGMGKTRFVSGMARGLNISAAVSSPTFALVHEYPGSPTLYHFDMYRISGYDDLYSTGFFDYLEAGGICVTEWSENIEQDLPPVHYEVRFIRGAGDDDRIVIIRKVKGRGEKRENSGN